MRHRIFTFFTLLLLAVLLFASWILGSQGGTRWLFARGQVLLPAGLQIEALSGRLTGPLTITGLQYRSGAVSVAIRRATLDWHPAALFTGTVHLTTLQFHDIRITQSGTGSGDDAPQGSAPLTLPPLPLRVTVDQATADSIRILSGDQAEPFTLTDTVLQLHAADSLITLRRFSSGTDRQRLHLSGRLETRPSLPLSLEVEYRQTLDDGRTIHSRGSLHGDMDKLTVEQDIAGPLPAHVSASLHDILTELHWQARLTTATLPLSQLQPSWPAGNASMQIDASGDQTTYNLRGMARISPASAPALQVQLSATGDHEALRVDTIELTAARGRIHGSADLRRDSDSTLQWKLSLQGSDIDPGLIWKEWPGHLGFRTRAQGRIGAEHTDADIVIDHVRGTLRDFPVALQARLALQPSRLEITRLQFRSGDSQVRLHGSFAQQLALDWEIHSPDLRELHHAAQGRIDAQGHVAGTPSRPDVRFSAQGRELRWRRYRIASLDGNGKLDLYTWQTLQLDLQLQGIVAQQRRIGDLLLAVRGTDRDHHVSLDLNNASGQLHARLRGRYLDRQWRGQLHQASFVTARGTAWQLARPVPLHITATALDAEALCWQAQSGRLCVNIRRQQQLWHAGVEADGMPLTPLAALLPEALSFTGRFSGTATLDYRRDSGIQGDARLRLSPGDFTYPLIEGEQASWSYDRGTLVLRLGVDGLASTMALSSAGDRIQLDAALPGFDPLRFDAATQPVRITAHGEMKRLGLIEALLPEVQDLQGTLFADMAVGGTLTRPEVNGTLQLNDGRVRIPRLGLQLESLSLSAQAQDNNSFTYELGVTSGRGRLQLSGESHFRTVADWDSTLRVSGQDVELVRIPEARITASPDLTVSVQPYEVHINGTLAVPVARLQPRDLGQATPISDDVTIVGNPATSPDRKWKIYSDLHLLLGERVHFYGFGFEGRLSGDLKLTDQPRQPTLATGEVTINDGSYQAYGQHLSVDQGRLLFTGGLLTNPGLNLRAVRQIGEVTAGVRIGGTLESPRTELFSVPAMGQTETLAYLILGRPLAQASDEDGAVMASAALALGLSGGDLLARKIGDRFGLEEMRIASGDSGDQASLIIGRYLNPRLYLSYGIGLLQSVNTLYVRYRMSRHWQFKAESGEQQGADLLYVIER